MSCIKPKLHWLHFIWLFVYILGFLTSVGLSSHVDVDESHPTTTLSRIAFASCNKQWLPNRLWDVIQDYTPQVYVWLGDNVYADKKVFGIPMWRVPGSLTDIKRSYDTLLADPGYHALTEKTSIIGTWDDHDYGENDGGASFKDKTASQHLFLDFLGVPSDHPRRERNGVYSSTTYGLPPHQVQSNLTYLCLL